MITDRGTARAIAVFAALVAAAAATAGCHDSQADVYAKAFDKTATPPAGFTAWHEKAFGGGGAPVPGAPGAAASPAAPK